MKGYEQEEFKNLDDVNKFLDLSEEKKFDTKHVQQYANLGLSLSEGYTFSIEQTLRSKLKTLLVKINIGLLTLILPIFLTFVVAFLEFHGIEFGKEMLLVLFVVLPYPIGNFFIKYFREAVEKQSYYLAIHKQGRRLS